MTTTDITIILVAVSAFCAGWFAAWAVGSEA
jgi:hypothetical protein